jgi:Fe-S-cluster containining protein
LAGGQLPVVYTRASTFAYRCQACRRCCYGKRIQVNPYELARLARNLGTTTTDMIGRFTVNGGTALANQPDGACIFLGDAGCTVHPDRPLVCRLYPLGRIVQADGTEAIVENEPHPDTEGLYGAGGSVGDYLESQDVAPFIAAADRYYAVFARLMADAPPDANPPMTADGAVPADAQVFVDADLAVLAGSCDEGGSLDADALVERHLALIARWAAQLDGA